MRVLMVLPSLTEAKSAFWRPIKYSLFPPLGLATLASYLSADDDVRIVDEHVEQELVLEGRPHVLPDLVVVQTYITSAYRAYRIADFYRSLGCFVALGGLHATSLPHEAQAHADALFLGPGEATFPEFLRRWRMDGPAAARGIYDSRTHPRSLADIPPIRRDLVRRGRYLVPNSIVVSRGCPHRCSFCYKEAFFEGGSSFYVQRVDAALAEIERLPGRHLYFLDDHLLGDPHFARQLFAGLRGMGRLFQGAATVDSILRGDLVERAAEAGLKSIFIGFESLSEAALKSARKHQNLERQGRRRDYEAAVRRLDALGVMINGSFVFGLDGDGPDVFDRTVDWAIEQGLTTATFHIATPYPGTAFFREIERADRLLHRRWDLYDTRRPVFRPSGMTCEQLEEGYWRSYQRFYSWRGLLRASAKHVRIGARVKHFGYAAAWRKFDPAWNLLIRSGLLAAARPVIEAGLAAVRLRHRESTIATTQARLDAVLTVEGRHPEEPEVELSAREGSALAGRRP